MASRRAFTFGSMILALTGVRAARASIPELDAEPATAPPDPALAKAPELGFAFTASRMGAQLQVNCTVRNLEREPIELVASRGSMPGAYLQATIRVDDRAYELPLIYQGDRRQFLSRVGPMPRYAQIAGGGTLPLAPYQFEWPVGAPDQKVRLSGGIDVAGGHYVAFAETVRLGDADAS